MESGSLSETIPGTGLDAATATAADLQRAITSGQQTSAGLTAFYLARIERLNPALRAVITVSESAAADAAASDQARASAGGHPPAAAAGPAANGARPLAGIPVLIKDNVSVRGMPATAGLARRWPAPRAAMPSSSADCARPAR